ncbi:MAG TPA: hypothetical protein VNT23_08000, partial [Gaiellaceae bacterium]|nr:hypothetical protein [Gaiellaceae bacterium]
MIRAILVALVAAATLAAAGPAEAATAPTGLKVFLLRADEPPTRSFPRTPSFGWNPVPAALRYEFELSTSSAFRESGIVYSDTTLTSPVASPALTLPWISSSMFARVRAVLAEGPTAWSASLSFEVEPPPPPRPLPSYPGLLRWTPVEGAVGYQIWFVDIPKMVFTSTNVADQREFYTFHQAASWLGQVRWRVRAARNDYNSRANGLPAATYGAWSPVYSSANPPFAVGPLRPVATVSDVVSSGSASSPAHRLMPAFVLGGSRSFAGADTELYRVHVFTDRRCVNRVYTSAIVGSPAYAPRLNGPLALPRTAAALAAARTTYLPNGNEGPTYLADMEAVVPNELQPSVKPTTSLPAGTAAAAPTTGGAPATGGTSAIELLKIAGASGPPVHLWDTDWTRGGGYYWTVVPVEAAVPGAASTAVTGGGSALNATTVPIVSSAGFATGDVVNIGTGTNAETATITAVTAGQISVAAPLTFAHGAGETVVRVSGSLQYRDLELAQDACAAGRVLRFGKESEPSLTAAGELFATGLSPNGRLVSASSQPRFYGSPLVGWTTALGAQAYAVQWSKTRVPFRPETDPATNALGLMTLNTSAVLPLQPGTWYYRVRGYDYSLPTGAQALSWSAPQQLVVTRPTFAVVSGAAAKRRPSATKVVRIPAGAFSLELPQAFRPSRAPASTSSLRPLGATGSSLRFSARHPRGAAVFVQTKAAAGSYSQAAWTRAAIASAKRTPGR